MKYFGFLYWIISIFFLLYSGNLDAQTSVELSENKELSSLSEKEMQEKWTASLGTFQFQVIDVRTQPAIHISIIEKIEAARSEDKDVYLPFIDDIRIYVPSKNKIAQKEFKKLDLIVYVKSKDLNHE